MPRLLSAWQSMKAGYERMGYCHVPPSPATFCAQETQRAGGVSSEATKISKGCSTSAMGKGWESWGCRAWRRLHEGFTAASQYLKEPAGELEREFLERHVVTGEWL